MSGLTLSVSLATDASDSDATAETVTPAHSVASAATGDGIVGANQLRWQGQMLTMSRLLGSGKFANVYELVPSAEDPEQQASKLVAKVTSLANLSPWARVQLKQEEEIWRSLSHPNIVRCYGYLLDTTRHVLLIERAPGGELFDWIMDATTSSQPFDEATAARQVHQVLSAVEYLHARGVLHRDLKPENLLLTSAEADAAIKVADFGASKRVSTATTPRLGVPTTPCGSLGYAAPEQLRSGGPQATYDAAVDLWSVGVITYILLSGTMPFDPSTYGDKPLRVTFPAAAFATVSEAARAFVVALLQVDPTRRLSAAEALQDPWLRAAPLRVDVGLLEQMPPVPPPPTPLATPGRLRELRASGQLQQQWARQADEYVRQAEQHAALHAANARGGRWVEQPHDAVAGAEAGSEVVAGAEAGAEAEAAAEAGSGAAKRVHGEEEAREEVTLMLPPEVHKRLKGDRPAA